MTPLQYYTRITFNEIPSTTKVRVHYSSQIMLQNGLKFIPTSHSTLEKAENQLNEALHKMRVSQSFAPVFHFAPDTAQCPALRIPKGMVNSEELPVLTNYFNAVANDLRTYLYNIDGISPPWNYKKLHLKKLFDITNRDDIDVTELDKNLGIMFTTPNWRVAEAHRQLSNQQTYRPINLDTAKDHRTEVLDFINSHRNSFLSVGNLTEDEYQGLLAAAEDTKDDVFPKFRLTAKIHKHEDWKKLMEEDLRGRPIVGAHSSFTTGLSKFVDSHLKPFITRKQSVLNDSKELVTRLFYADTSNSILGTADVESLYPSIPTDEAIDLIFDFLMEETRNAAYATFITDCLRVVLKNNVLQFDGLLWLQLEGTAMGTNCAPSFANTYLYMLERKLDLTGIRLFCRYIDDIFFLADNAVAAERLLDDYNKLSPSISIEGTFGSTVNFLNLTLFISNNTLHHKPYAKNFNKFLYLPFRSFHPIHMKKAFIKGMLQAHVINSSSYKIFAQERDLFFHRLRARGYPLSLLRPIFLSVLYSERLTSLLRDRSVPIPPKRHCFLSLPYNRTFASIPVNKILAEHWPSVANSPVGTTFSRQPMVSWQRSRNLLDIIHSECSKNFAQRAGPP